MQDICDDLVGEYLKSFKFSGWHPHCLCYTIPILKTEEEFLSLDDTKPSVNAVADTPANFKQWVRDNKERIEAASERGKLPYFLRDNLEAWERVVYPRKNANKHGYGAAMKLGRAATKEAINVIEDVGAPVLSKEQKRNIYELADALGILRKNIKPMSFVDADHGISNPERNKDNCQSVVVAFVARRRGLDCVAKSFSKDNASQVELMKKFQNAFLIKDKKGNYRPINPTVIKGKSDDEIIAKIRKQLSADGEYILGINYKPSIDKSEGDGHVINIISKNGKLIIHDEQQNKDTERFITIESLNNIDSVEIIKTDKALLNIKIAKNILSMH